MITVTLLGAGNVGQHLYLAFLTSKKVQVTQWYNRTLDRIQKFKNNVAITNNLCDLQQSDIYIISTSDCSVVYISENIPFSNKVVLHTSGSINMHHLDKKNNRGVFYPLQTFTKGALLNFNEVPFCIEVERKSDYTIVKKLALETGGICYRINSDQRAALHLAAVFINNFTNQLYRIAHEITESKSVEFDILKPLIKETAKKVQTISPYMAQTGPAVRGDQKTIERHMKMIRSKEHKEIYDLITKAIKKIHGNF